MKTAIYAALFHCISTDQKPQHKKCPSGIDSRCFYQSSLAHGKKPGFHKDWIYKTPIGQHRRQFNAPTIDEGAIVIVGEEFNSRDIILHRRNGEVQQVSETHCSYDALQYTILFWHGEDEYNFNINMRNPTTNVDINKKVSAMNYYAYRVLIRENADNHILKCTQLFHQYVVDMYAKMEGERLLYIRLNQVKLRSEEYIHLRDAVVNDGNLSE
ncbi:helitron_like_N domain-containing protein [Trichonephila clavipes]|nr:helitron_like_N domain-containing protein [Trichonephila clavipes]